MDKDTLEDIILVMEMARKEEITVAKEIAPALWFITDGIEQCFTINPPEKDGKADIVLGLTSISIADQSPKHAQLAQLLSPFRHLIERIEHIDTDNPEV